MTQDCADDRLNDISAQFSHPDPSTPLLALYPGLKQTGWAIIYGNQGPSGPATRVAASGAAGLRTRRKLDPQERITAQLETLNAVVDLQQPVQAILSRAGGVSRQQPGLRLLETALAEWADPRRLPLTVCSATEVRAAVAGRSNASKDELEYAVMRCLRLIGQTRSAHEWEAIAAGYYHLSRSYSDPGSLSVR